MNMSGSTPSQCDIELRVERIASLFDALDPSPIPSRDLEKHAEDFIVGWARELPKRAPIRILVHLPREKMEHESAPAVADAFRAHFNYRARVAKGDLDELFRVGRWSLAVGFRRARGLRPDQPVRARTRGRRVFHPPLVGGHPHPWLGGELATSGDFPLRLVAAG